MFLRFECTQSRLAQAIGGLRITEAHHMIAALVSLFLSSSNFNFASRHPMLTSMMPRADPTTQACSPHTAPRGDPRPSTSRLLCIGIDDAWC